MQRIAAIAERPGIVRPQRKRAIVARQRLVEPTEFFQKACFPQCIAKIIVSIRTVRPKLDHTPIGVGTSISLTVLPQGVTEVVISIDELRFELDRPSIGSYGLWQPTPRLQNNAQIAVSAGILFDCQYSP